MVRKPAGIISALVPLLASSIWSIAADAQETFVPPPIRPSVDENGVELVSGWLRLPRTDIVIGEPGAGGLSFGQMAPFTWVADWYSGAVTVAAGPTTTTYTVAVGGHAESFDKANSPSTSPFVSVQGLGSSMTQDGANYYHTAPDGTKATFSKSITNVGSRTAAAHIIQLTLPDGEIRTYHYSSTTVCASTCSTWWWLRAVTNNRGYQIKLLYQEVTVDCGRFVGGHELMA